VTKPRLQACQNGHCNAHFAALIRRVSVRLRRRTRANSVADTRARAKGAMEVLQECRPEFRASASFGYKKTEAQELTGEDGEEMDIEFSVETLTEDDR
jgi:hypothetical protein